MKINCGIIGLPNVGKSSLFNVLTNSAVKVENFPFCTIQPNIGILRIPDKRISQLMSIVQSKESMNDIIEFVDIAGLIKGAAYGEGLGNKILNHIRSVKVLFHVVRCFNNNKIVHVLKSIDPERDINIINTELILFDIFHCEKQITFLKNRNKNIMNDYVNIQVSILQKCLINLYNGVALRGVSFSKKEYDSIKGFNFLTFKPIIYIANIDANNVDNNHFNLLRVIASNNNIPIITCHIQSLLYHHKINNYLNNKKNVLQKKEYLINDVINEIFISLSLQTFFTINTRMIRAWTYMFGTTALEAANIVHSDFKNKFIRVQVIKFDDFIFYKGELLAKKAGKIFTEGKNYCIKDGEILKFLFHR